MSIRLLTILLVSAFFLLAAVTIGGVLAARIFATPTVSVAQAHVLALPQSQAAEEGNYPLSFQGVLMDDNGNPVPNGAYSVSFAIYNTESGSGVLWRETQTVFAFDGLFTVDLGVNEDIDPSIFSDNPRTYLGVRVGNNAEMIPRVRMAYSPYAIHALTADHTLDPPVNPARVAVNRWYEANFADIRVLVDDSPGAIAFDGESIWVATRGDADDDGDDNITKIRKDGVKLIEMEVESQPVAITFDGKHLWIVNQASESLTRVRPDGANKQTMPRVNGVFSELDRPVAIAFDGEFIWVANQGSNSVVKIQASDGGVVEDVPVGSNPTALAFDGEFLWVVHSGTQNITKIAPLTADVVDTLTAGRGQAAIAFDGVHMWVVDRGNNSVTKVRASDGEEIGTYSVGNAPVAIAFDGGAMWVVNSGSNNVTKLRASDGAVLGTFAVGRNPAGIAFDGTNVWISSRDEDTVYMR